MWAAISRTMGPYLGSVDKGELFWTLAGSAIKVAQSLGLSKLLPEHVVPAKARARVYGRRFGSLQSREVGRRIWAHLVSTSCLLSNARVRQDLRTAKATVLPLLGSEAGSRLALCCGTQLHVLRAPTAVKKCFALSRQRL